MNKTLIYIVGGVVVVGAVVALTMSKPGNTTPGENGSPAGTSGTSGMQSLKDLFALGTAQKCTFTNTTENAESNGTVYVSGGKMRGDFTSIAGGKTIQSHMIVDGGTSYVWSDAMMGQGVKMSFENMEAPSTAPQGAQGQSVDVNQKTNYSCSGWGVDQAMFTLPAGVEFNDLSAMMQGLRAPSAGAGTAPSGGTGNPAQCAFCAQAGDAESVAQCKAALGCK